MHECSFTDKGIMRINQACNYGIDTPRSRLVSVRHTLKKPRQDFAGHFKCAVDDFSPVGFLDLLHDRLLDALPHSGRKAAVHLVHQ